MRNRTTTTTTRPSTPRTRRGRLVRTTAAVIGVAGLSLACTVEDPEPGDPGFDDPPADIGG